MGRRKSFVDERHSLIGDAKHQLLKRQGGAEVFNMRRLDGDCRNRSTVVYKNEHSLCVCRFPIPHATTGVVRIYGLERNILRSRSRGIDTVDKHGCRSKSKAKVANCWRLRLRMGSNDPGNGAAAKYYDFKTGFVGSPRSPLGSPSTVRSFGTQQLRPYVQTHATIFLCISNRHPAKTAIRHSESGRTT